MKNLILGAFLAFIFTSYSVSAQIIFEQNSNSFPSGTYTRDQLIKDWNTTSGNGFSRRGKGEDRVSIVGTGTSTPSGKCLKVKYPANKVDSKESGAGWKTDLKGKYQELYMSYYVKFGPKFELEEIGKLPGLAGGTSFDDSERDTEWSGKLMWREGGTLQFYLHQPTSNVKQYNWPSNVKVVNNKWYHIQIHYKMNTVGKNDGIMEAWLDNKLVKRYTNIPFRKKNTVGITNMFFSTFYGGNYENDRPSRDNYAYFDDFKVSTKKIPYSGTSNDTNTGSTSNIFSIKKKDTNHYVDTGWGAQDKQRVRIYTKKDNNNQKFEEINHGNGYYSYKKKGTNYALDGGNGGKSGQLIYLFKYNASNHNQHWKKRKVSNGHYVLEKRNAKGFAIDGGNGVANNRQLKLWKMNLNNKNQQWNFSRATKSADQIDSDVEISALELYPNPASNAITIRNISKLESNVTIYNYSGKLVYSQNILSDTTSITVDTSSFSAGLYLVKMNGSGSQRIAKFSKL